MSHIMTRFSEVARHRLIARCAVAKTISHPSSHSKVFAVELSSNWPRIGAHTQYFSQLKSYSTKVTVKPKTHNHQENRIPKILSNLASNKVSLQFDKFTWIRPSLFRNYDVTAERGFDILKSCSQLVNMSADERVKLVNDAWNELVTIVKTPTKDHLVLLLQAYRRAGLESLQNYQNFFDRYNCPIDADIYAELMFITCQNAETMEKADALLKEIGEKNIEIDDKIYNALILGYSKQGIDAVEKVLETMKSKDIPLTLGTNTELIKAYISNENNDKAMELLQLSRDYNTDQLYDIIRSAASNGNEVIIQKALSLLPEFVQNVKLIAQNLQNICIEVVHSNRNRTPDTRLDPYQLIIRHLPVPKFEMEDSTEYGAFLLKEMIVINESVPDILRLCENLIESNRNLNAIHICCIYSLTLNLSTARAFLEALAAREPLRSHYFWPLFSKSRNQDETLEITRLATKLNTVLDIETLSKYVLPQTNVLAKSQAALKALTDVGVRMLELKTASIGYLLQQNRPKESLEIACRSTSSIDPFIIEPALIKFIKSKYYTKNAHTTATLIGKLQQRTNDKTYDLAGQIAVSICDKRDQVNDFNLTRRLLTDYERLGVKISPNAANAILEKLQKIRNIQAVLKPTVEKLIDRGIFPEIISDSKISKSALEIEPLEQQLAELRANGLPTHGVMYRLVLKNVQYMNYEKAIELKKQCDEEGVIETPAMKSTLLKLWTATKDENKALQVLRALQQKHSHFKIDTYKIVDLATLLITKDRINDANKLFDNLKSSDPEKSRYLSKNIWELLSAASNYGVRHGTTENHAAHFLKELISKGLCEPSNKLLGTVIKEYIDKNDVGEAVAAFKNYGTEYRKTPQCLTLLTLLIELSNDARTAEYSISKEDAIDYVQQVIDLANSVHGTEKANVNVILAFASAGNEQQLRKILMDPVVKFDPSLMMDSLNYLKDRMKIKAVIAIARCARGLRHNSLNEETLYEFILDDFVRTNDYTSAIQLFKEIRKCDESSVSKKFSKILIELLKKNNQPLPEQLQVLSY